jgi:hypothetical protein
VSSSASRNPLTSPPNPLASQVRAPGSTVPRVCPRLTGSTRPSPAGTHHTGDSTSPLMHNAREDLARRASRVAHGRNIHAGRRVRDLSTHPAVIGNSRRCAVTTKGKKAPYPDVRAAAQHRETGCHNTAGPGSGTDRRRLYSGNPDDAAHPWHHRAGMGCTVRPVRSAHAAISW